MPISAEAQQLKNLIATVILDNYNEEITPAIMRQVLGFIVDFADGGLVISTGTTFKFLGLVIPNSTQNILQSEGALAIAITPGAYINFKDNTNASLVLGNNTYLSFFYKAPGLNDWVQSAIPKMVIPTPPPQILPKLVTLSGTINGINTTFNTPDDFELQTLIVIRNGKIERPINDYTADFSGDGIYNKIVFVNPPVSEPLDTLGAYYIPKS